jgi:hypothetical protein
MMQAALTLIKKACSPMSSNDITRELVRLKAVTVSKNANDQDQALQISAYIYELQQYPADGVINAMRDWPKHNKWFPSLYELTNAIDFRCRERILKRNFLLEVTNRA